MLSFDGDSRQTTRHCPDCGQSHESVTGFVLKEDSAYAVYYVDWYPHSNEAYVDAILGSWDGPGYDDNVTFGCRLGEVEGYAGPQASLVTGGAQRGDKPIMGTKLERDDALRHPLVAEFWELVDWLIVNDSLLHERVYHMDGTAGSTD
ncbi:MAG TPA: hypothetical protein VFS66_08010 [Acidimicrobiia bacterium]|nr:hypothetical protein [Acidimicrobiia bacterium]